MDATVESAIQFDELERAGSVAEPGCARCRRQVHDYYELGGHMLCPSCAGSFGSAAWDGVFLRALLFGAGAALIGLVAGSALPGFPLVRIAVGLLIGYAVRKGARGRGGWRYQTLAMALTCLAITVTATPVDEGFELALVVPFLTSRGDLIGVIVIGVALYLAWKPNRGVPMSGPFRLGGGVEAARTASPAAVRICAGCAGELAPAFLACPRCGRLVHTETLKGLASEGESAEHAAEHSRALAAWRQVLALLPTGSGQHTRVQGKVQALSAMVSPASPFGGVGAAAGPAATTADGAARSGWKKWATGAGAVGVVLLKFKWVLLFLLTKGKVLLVGLTQAKTFLSMALAVGVYTTIYGWWFALGLVVSIYIHEMGHVVWLRHFGIPATAPMFIPGLGAFVRLKAHPATVGEDARVGLAGPVWGAGAAILALALGLAFDRPILFAIARVGAWINVFNLLPVWQLDGGRGFAALSRRQRGIVAAVAWVLALAGADFVFFFLAIAATIRAASTGTAPEQGDRNVLLTYLALVVGLAAIMVGVGKI